jgi:hypothetical protein
MLASGSHRKAPGSPIRSASQSVSYEFQWTGGLVELRGIEPLTSAVRLQRSPI